MPYLSHSNRIKELDELIGNQDLNRWSTRILDLTNDYQYDKAIKTKSLAFRRKYNEKKELGSGKVSKDYLEEAMFFLDEVKGVGEVSAIDVMDRKMICRVSEIEKKFSSRLHQFHFKPISFDMTQGQIIGLVGENGNGKTTLLRMVAGDLSIDGGALHYFEDGVLMENWEDVKRKVAFIPQRIPRWFGTVEENLAFECALKGIPSEEVNDKVEFMIQRMGLHNFRELSWTELSSGYKLRVEIAKTLVWDPIILILDEPLANLDIQAQEILLSDLRNLADSLASPKSIILSSQQLFNVESIADHVIFLKNGQTIHNGTLKGLKSDVPCIEVQGEFSIEELKACFTDIQVRIQTTASGFSISFPEMNHEDALKRMIDQGLVITYYRDITSSTKRFFNDQY